MAIIMICLLFLFWSIIELEASFPYRDVQLTKGPISKDIYDISAKELGR